MMGAGAEATVTLRVVGRNTKGPMGTLVIPVGGTKFPIDFAITRAELREGLPDFIWAEEDIYLAADVTNSGKVLLKGKSKSKFADGVHKQAFVTCE